MDLKTIRLIAIKAIFDAPLTDRLYLKGGNALNLIHRIGSRASLDLDLSLEDDFDDAEDAAGELFRAITAAYREHQLHVFDTRFVRRPSNSRDPSRRWGGYDLRFKLSASSVDPGELPQHRRTAELVGVNQERVFTIQISKFEFCDPSTTVSVDDARVRVYSPALIAIEKLRAICQQLPSYRMNKTPSPRARDFYDIETICSRGHMSFATQATREVVEACFAAKEVPVVLMAQIPVTRDFHRLDWPAVEATVSEPLNDYDYYFDFVVDQTRKLHVLWDE
jgi:predicted nucleotidyltransferase component of viral defense system